MNFGGIVLCGGLSSRMGFPKANLPFGNELMLQRVVRLLSTAVRPVVVVAAPRQSVPPLPPEVLLVRDTREAHGPLEGLRAGLSALSGRVEAAYATSCDAPLLAPAFVLRMCGLLENYDLAIPRVADVYQPLAAVYGTWLVPIFEQLLAENRLRTAALMEHTRARVVTEAELTPCDAALHTLRNCNEPAEYLAALSLAGLTPSPEVMAQISQASRARGVEP